MCLIDSCTQSLHVHNLVLVTVCLIDSCTQSLHMCLIDSCTQSCFGNIQTDSSVYDLGCTGTESILVNCSYRSMGWCRQAAGVYCGKYDHLQCHLIDGNFPDFVGVFSLLKAHIHNSCLFSSYRFYICFKAISLHQRSNLNPKLENKALPFE